MKKEKYAEIELLRVLLTIAVIVGHTYIFFFRENPEYTRITCQNMSVDGFFIIAGLLMMKRFCFGNEEISERNYIKYIIGRFFRLWPSMAMVIFIWIAFYMISGRVQTVNNAIEYLPSFFMLSRINNFGGIGALWYVAALFWGQMIIAGIILFKPHGRTLILSAMFFLGISYMYSSFSGLSLNYNPLVGGFVSAGLIKAVTGLSLGSLIWLLAHHINVNNEEDKAISHIKIALCFAFEVLSLLGLAYCFYIGENCKLNYLIYPCLSMLLMLILTSRSIVLKQIAKLNWGKLGRYCYDSYIIHTLLMEIALYIGAKEKLANIDCILIYILWVIISFIAGGILHIIKLWGIDLWKTSHIRKNTIV